MPNLDLLAHTGSINIRNGSAVIAMGELALNVKLISILLLR